MAQLGANTLVSNGAGFNDVITFQNSSGIENGRICRTWVSFNGTSTVAIRTNFNVSSITDHGTGQYTVNFNNALSDANYTANVSSGKAPAATRSNPIIPTQASPTTTSCRLATYDGPQNSQQDAEFISVLFFR